MATYKLTQQSGQFSGGGSFTNFPAYVDLSEIDASMSQADADSIRVYSDEALTTELAREIVSTEEMHVKIPSFSASDEIWVDYDGVRSDYAVGATFGRNAVWRGYVAVWHMGEASGNAIDSTGNGNNLPDNNSVGSAAGQIGDGRDFESSNSEWLGAIDAFGYTTDFTVTAFIKPESLTGSPSRRFWVAGKMGDSGNRGWVVEITDDLDSPSRKIRFDGQSAGTIVGSTTVPTDSFTHVATTWESGSQVIYFNGASDGTGSSTTSLDVSTDGFSIGQGYDTDNGGNYSDGIQDETRIRASILSANWITTEYNNQNSPSTFWSVEEVVTEVTKNPLFAFGGM